MLSSQKYILSNVDNMQFIEFGNALLTMGTNNVFKTREIDLTACKLNGRKITAISSKELQAAVDSAKASGMHVFSLKFDPVQPDLIRVALECHFDFHHADTKEVYMIRCLSNHEVTACPFPSYKTLSVGITCVIFNQTLDKIIAIKENYGSKWKAITGSVDYCNSEENPLQAAIREVKEEVGVELDNESALKLVAVAWTSLFRGYAPDNNWIFTTKLSEECSLQKQEDEIAKAEWKPVAELLSSEADDVGSHCIRSALKALKENKGLLAVDTHWQWDVKHEKPVLMYCEGI
jgi:8-oxo-dGTP pyrophosphatase MutT (NUDIX family)